MRNGPYLENLRAAGANPEDINFVFCTHLHIDHVGWNTRLENGRSIPTFPNARYLFSKADYDAFDPRQRFDGKRSRRDATFEDSVLPVVEAKLALMVDGMHPIDDNLMIEPVPGHSPGHSLLRASGAVARVRCSSAISCIIPSKSRCLTATVLLACVARASNAQANS